MFRKQFTAPIAELSKPGLEISHYYSNLRSAFDALCFRVEGLAVFSSRSFSVDVKLMIESFLGKHR